MSEAERRERQAAIQATMLGGSGGGGVSRIDFLYALERSNPSCRWGRFVAGYRGRLGLQVGRWSAGFRRALPLHHEPAHYLNARSTTCTAAVFL